MGFLVSPRFTDLSEDRQRYAMQNFLQMAAQIANSLTFLNRDGGITDGSKVGNFDAVWVIYVSNATPDTEDTVPHELDRIPIGAIVCIPDKAARAYDSDTEWTSSNLFLRADVATVTVNIIVF